MPRPIIMWMQRFPMWSSAERKIHMYQTSPFISYIYPIKLASHIFMPGFFYCPIGNQYKKYNECNIDQPVVHGFRYRINISNQDQVGPVSRVFITAFNPIVFKVIHLSFLQRLIYRQSQLQIMVKSFDNKGC